MKHALQSARAVLPGSIIKRELKARGWTQKELAEIMGRPESKISPIIRGTMRITPRTAIELAEVFGTSADVWINLEARYRLRLAEQEVPRGEIARRSLLFKALPVRELISRGWISDSKDVGVLEKEICSLLGVSNSKEIPALTASFRGSKQEEANTAALVAWCQRARQIAGGLPAGEFDLRRFKKECVPQILERSMAVEDLESIPHILAEYGIRFLVLRHLGRTYLDGSVLEVSGQPAVVLTLRYDRIDSFWFTLLHELAHIYKAHKGDYLDRDVDHSNGDANEDEANQLAAEWLVPSESLSNFKKRSTPYYSSARIEEYAHSIARHPGIVLGQLQKDSTVPYKNLRALLVRVSPSLQASIAN